MKTLYRNIIANYFGKAWISVIGIIFIPIYISQLGIESIGIIGFYGSLLALFSFLDFGFNQTVVREAGRSTAQGLSQNSFSELFGTLEYVYYILALLLMIVCLSASDLISKQWLTSESLSSKSLRDIVVIVSAVAATSWLKEIYRSVLIGLQRQVLLNGFDTIFSTLRIVGAAGILFIFTPSITIFFVYQGIITFIELIVLRLACWKSVKRGFFHIPNFYFRELKRVWKFSGGVSLISITGYCTSQFDKLFLPGMVSLKEFGYYTLAQLLGRSLILLVNPVTMAFRPLFSQQVVSNEEELLRNNYHKASQLMSASIIPASVILAVFSHEIIYLWTNDIDIANQASATMSLLALGTMLNGLVNIPYSIQLAYGWVSAPIKTNLLLSMLSIPAFLFFVNLYGIVAAGWIWFLLNIGYLCVNLLVLHSRYLLGSLKRWYLVDTLPIIFGASFLAILSKLSMSGLNLDFKYMATLIPISASIIFISILTLYYPRQHLFKLIKKLYARS